MPEGFLSSKALGLLRLFAQWVYKKGWRKKKIMKSFESFFFLQREKKISKRIKGTGFFLVFLRRCPTYLWYLLPVLSLIHYLTQNNARRKWHGFKFGKDAKFLKLQRWCETLVENFISTRNEWISAQLLKKRFNFELEPRWSIEIRLQFVLKSVKKPKKWVIGRKFRQNKILINDFEDETK